jgi:TRAP-type C4-dicarboxylate transport system permease small subunit
MRMLRVIDRLVRQLSHLGFLIGAALLLVLGVMGFIDVITLNLFHMPVPGLLEVSGTLLAVIVFLGLAEAQARDANISIDLFTQRMSPLPKRLCELLSLAIGAALMIAIAWRTATLAWTAWTYHEVALGALAFPTTPGKAVAFLGACIASAEFLRQFFRALVAPLDRPVP